MASIRVNDRIFGSIQYGRLSPEQCQKLHSASLEILARTGVRLYEQEAIDLLKKAGAFVSEGNRVRIPGGLVNTTKIPCRSEGLPGRCCCDFQSPGQQVML